MQKGVGSLLSLGTALLLALPVGEAWGKSQAPRKTLPVLEDSLPRWGRVARSPEQLIRNSLHRLAARDTLGLMLMVPDPALFLSLYSKTPEGLAANEAQTNFSREFFYMDNQKLLLRRLGRDGGKRLELVSWKAASPPTLLKGGGRILRDIEIEVRDPADGKVRPLFFVQSIYEGPKGCKIWGFQDERNLARTGD